MVRPASQALKTLAGLVAVSAVLSAATGCVAPATPHAPSVTAPVTVRVRTADRIVSIPLEEYVLGSALSEVSPVGETPSTVARIFEVQAVLARTYALAHMGRHEKDGYDLCDATHCQLYEPGRIGPSRFTEAARQAVEATRGLVLVSGLHAVDALYHSDCGGHTAAADAVWGGAPVSYLPGTIDDVPTLTHRKWQFDLPLTRLRTALNLDARTAVGRRLDRISVVARDDSGRAARLEVKGTTTRVVTGEQFRTVLNQTFGDRAVMSTRFQIAKLPSALRLTGTGFGHGVGLCQVGAAARARQAEPVAAILAAYFPGANLVPVRSVMAQADMNLFGGRTAVLLKSP